jgi:molecular chaperone GrpE
VKEHKEHHKEHKGHHQEKSEEAVEVSAPEGGQAVGGEGVVGELEQARAEAAANYDKYVRAVAEFENQKKRLQRDKETALKFAEENLIRELLPSLDNLERALNQDRNGVDFGIKLLEGVEMTRRGLVSTLEKFGLRPLESVGEPFDPNFHEALAMEASSEVPEQKVLKEYEKGYFLKDRLLRAAKVVVSKGNCGC